MAAVLIAGCGCGNDSSASKGSSTSSGGSATGTPMSGALKVGLVFDSGGKGDKSFNDSANAGLEKAEKELKIDGATTDSKSEKDYDANLSGLADKGYQLVFAVGITQADALKNVAPKYSADKFAIIDGDVDAPNVRSLQFAEEQGSFLAGYAAGLATKTNKIGFVGGMDIPLIRKFLVGYEAGAKTANNKIEILPPKFTSNWTDTSMGKAAAQVLFDQGADIVYHASGRCGLGVIDAAKEAGKLAIGVDSDQDDVAPGSVLTSMVKHVDRAVFQTIKDDQDGKFSAGVKRYDLADGGVGLTDFKNTKDKIGGQAGLDKLKKVTDLIIAGKITVPATEADLAKFQPPTVG
jgi:basic membrane protein A